MINLLNVCKVKKKLPIQGSLLALHLQPESIRRNCRLYYYKSKKMKNIKQAKEMISIAEAYRAEGKTIGFVPTMGALHSGHISLIEQSRQQNDLTVCSIFVNPIQFNNADDLRLYPRMPEADLGMLEAAGCDVVFMPSAEEMYPEPVTKQYRFGSLDTVMEGAFRPGHFNGVAIVVHKLFELVRPHRAYFGLKDYQQLLVIREMVRQEGHPIDIVGCPIVREPDGLAMSSRNLRLNPADRKNAAGIYQALLFARNAYRTMSPEELESVITQRLEMIPGATVEYVSVADGNTLLKPDRWPPVSDAVVCVVVYLGDIRLIDNIILTSPHESES
jgi:pantoate--beta-alanine ligase